MFAFSTHLSGPIVEKKNSFAEQEKKKANWLKLATQKKKEILKNNVDPLWAIKPYNKVANYVKP